MSLAEKAFPPPVELSPAELEATRIARRLGQAVADQHPGVSISEAITSTGFLLDVSHVAHNWTLQVDREEHDSPTTLENKAKTRAMVHYFDQWHRTLWRSIQFAECSNADGVRIMLENGISGLVNVLRQSGRGRRPRIYIIGNGGSSAIAGHMAEDFTKNGGARALTFNDPAMMSCYANDYGWDEAFKEAVADHAEPGDYLICISSSGRSKSITTAAEWARKNGLFVVTFSGFDPDNELRKIGGLNFWVPSHQYGFVETAHSALLHAALDLHLGWVGQG